MSPDAHLDVVIVGGSLAGLMHGIVLTRLGHNVRVLERSQSNSREQQGGAGIGTGVEGKRFIAQFDDSGRPYAFSPKGFHYLGMDGKISERRKFGMNLTSWAVLYYRLRWLFDGLFSDVNPKPRLTGNHEGKAIVQLGANVLDVQPADDDPGGKMIVTWQGPENSEPGCLLADLVIDASGFGSKVRQNVLGDVSVSYEGVVALRGSTAETAVSDTTLAIFDERAGHDLVFSVNQEGSYCVGYIIPGSNGSMARGNRFINWVWYTPLVEGSEAWRRTMTGKDGIAHRTTIPIGFMTGEVRESFRAMAKEMLDPTYCEIVLKTDQPFLTAIRESLPSRISFFDGRLLLAGEAACLATPFAGAAVNQAAVSAFTLEKMVKGEVDANEWEKTVQASGNKQAAMSKSIGHGYLADRNFRIGEQVGLGSVAPGVHITHNVLTPGDVEGS